VAAPPLAILRRLEQPVDRLLIGVLARVGKKLLELFGRWRQPRQIESRPQEQRPLVGIGRKRQAFFAQLGKQKGVDRRPLAVFGGELRRLGARERLKEPIGPFLGRDVDARRKLLGFVARGRCPASDPLLDQRDLLGRQLLLSRRHLAAFDARQEQALGRLAGDNSRARVAPLGSESPQPPVEISLQLFTTVAVDAIGFQDRTDVPLEGQIVRGTGLSADRSQRKGHQD
jgi:hypothetical protein